MEREEEKGRGTGRRRLNITPEIKAERDKNSYKKIKMKQGEAEEVKDQTN